MSALAPLDLPITLYLRQGLLEAEGFPVQPDQVALAAPIRTLDKFRVPIRLADGIEAAVDVWVVPA